LLSNILGHINQIHLNYLQEHYFIIHLKINQKKYFLKYHKYSTKKDKYKENFLYNNFNLFKSLKLKYILAKFMLKVIQQNIFG